MNLVWDEILCAVRIVAQAITCKRTRDELGRRGDCENGKNHPEKKSCENEEKHLSERVKDIVALRRR